MSDPKLALDMEQAVKPKKYLDWANAGGPNECIHGYAAGIPCPQCDGAKLPQPPESVQEAPQPKFRDCACEGKVKHFNFHSTEGCSFESALTPLVESVLDVQGGGETMDVFEQEVKSVYPDAWVNGSSHGTHKLYCIMANRHLVQRTKLSGNQHLTAREAWHEAYINLRQATLAAFPAEHTANKVRRHDGPQGVHAPGPAPEEIFAMKLPPECSAWWRAAGQWHKELQEAREEIARLKGGAAPAKDKCKICLRSLVDGECREFGKLHDQSAPDPAAAPAKPEVREPNKCKACALEEGLNDEDTDLGAASPSNPSHTCGVMFRKWFQCPSCMRGCYSVCIDGIWACGHCFPVSERLKNQKPDPAAVSGEATDEYCMKAAHPGISNAVCLCNKCRNPSPLAAFERPMRMFLSEEHIAGESSVASADYDSLFAYAKGLQEQIDRLENK